METSLITVLIGGVIISIVSFCVGLLVSRGVMLKARRGRRKAELNMLESEAELLEYMKEAGKKAAGDNVSHHWRQ